MASLAITLIDVGWGDSILIEGHDEQGRAAYGLVDSNDTTDLRSSFIFLKRHFEKKGVQLPRAKPVFDFVILSHAHADHGQGLKPILRHFGTKRFWYPKSLAWGGLSTLLAFANRSASVGFHQAIDRTKRLPNFGDIVMKVLWPPHNRLDRHNENNNSVVLELHLDEVSFLLTGDAEREVWQRIAQEIPRSTRFFKVPHHGSVNGTLLTDDSPAWLEQCPAGSTLGISSHVVPFQHPDRQVTDLFDQAKRTYYRTDRDYHITVETDGVEVSVRYSHYQ